MKNCYTLPLCTERCNARANSSQNVMLSFATQKQEFRSTVAYTFAQDPNTTTLVSSTEKISELEFSIQTQSTGKVVFKSGSASSYPTSFFLLNLD